MNPDQFCDKINAMAEEEIVALMLENEIHGIPKQPEFCPITMLAAKLIDTPYWDFETSAESVQWETVEFEKAVYPRDYRAVDLLQGPRAFILHFDNGFYPALEGLSIEDGG